MILKDCTILVGILIDTVIENCFWSGITIKEMGFNCFYKER